MRKLDNYPWAIVKGNVIYATRPTRASAERLMAWLQVHDMCPLGARVISQESYLTIYSE